MYPNFYFLAKKLTGLDVPMFFKVIQTFGLFMAIAFIVGGWVLALEMKRKTQLGLFKPIVRTYTVTGSPTTQEIITNILLGYILGGKLFFIVQNMEAFLQDAASVVLSPKVSIAGGILGIAAMVGYKFFEKIREAKRHGKGKTIRETLEPQELVGDIVIVAAISGLLGAKIAALAETPEAFFDDPIGQLLSGSGLSIYGGLILAFFVVYAFIKSKGLSPIQIMDASAPVLLLSYGVGRLGCHFSGDGDWGIVNEAPKPMGWLPDWMWSFKYPNNVLGRNGSTFDAQGNELFAVPMENCSEFATTFPQYCFELPKGVYPTSVYEALIMFASFAVFWWVLRLRVSVPGLLFFLYMTLNGVERFWVETIRINLRYENWFNWSQAQIIAVFIIAGGIIGSGVVVFRHRNAAKKTTDLAANSEK